MTYNQNNIFIIGILYVSKCAVRMQEAYELWVMTVELSEQFISMLCYSKIYLYSCFGGLKLRIYCLNMTGAETNGQLEMVFIFISWV